MIAAYTALEARFSQIEALESAAGVLGWDSTTMMPPKGAAHRGAQLAALHGAAHRLLVAPEVGRWLARAEAKPPKDRWQQANLRCMQHRYLHAAAVKPTLVEKFWRAASACEFAWREARANNDFPTLLPLLENMLNFGREAAEAKATALNLSPYDALLDSNDPGRRIAVVEKIFAMLAKELPPLIAQVEAKQAKETLLPLPKPPYDIEKQKQLGLQVMGALGFDFEGGRMDVSAHPFCSGSRGDVRLTARYDANEWMSSLMAMVHETGHGLYEQHLPEAWIGQPVGAAQGMALHESQSLSIEMQLCRSRAFMDYLAPLLQQHFGGAWSADAIYAHATRVKRSFIRVDADEVTYPLHVILRTRIEQRLLDGSLAIKELPEAWNEQMQSLLGITPPDNASGCMQDIHWMAGSVGYFPTYTLGALTAAQLFASLRREVPTMDASVARGDFAPVVGWLAEKVHAQGSLLSSEALLEQATGEPLNPKHFLAHVRTRYLGE